MSHLLNKKMIIIININKFMIIKKNIINILFYILLYKNGFLANKKKIYIFIY